MPLEEITESSPPLRKSGDEKKRIGSVNDDAKPDEAKGGMRPYLASPQHHNGYKQLTVRKRVFRYADKTSWLLNGVAFIAAIAAGTLLPLMDLVFGKFVTAFNGFAVGSISPSEYRSQVNKYTYEF
jgi:ATP-binding cassette subfamily B (MDR/TAP) protein 1